MALLDLSSFMNEENCNKNLSDLGFLFERLLKGGEDDENDIFTSLYLVAVVVYMTDERIFQGLGRTTHSIQNIVTHGMNQSCNLCCACLQATIHDYSIL